MLLDVVLSSDEAAQTGSDVEQCASGVEVRLA